METLNDTQKYMLSDDYKERFMAEYWQLKIRWERLHMTNMMLDLEAYYGIDKLGFDPDCPNGLLEEQESCMRSYLNTLEQRAIIEDIDLTVPPHTW